MVIVKVLHEVRVYIHLILKERKELNAELNQNIEKLKDMYDRVFRSEIKLW